MAVTVRDDQVFWSAHFPGTRTSVPAARQFTVQSLHALGRWDDDEVAQLLVSEVATNVVLHAHSPMRITVWCHDDRPRIEIRDDEPRRPHRDDPEPLAVGGRGMLLVDALAADWGVNGNSRGKTVWFEL